MSTSQSFEAVFQQYATTKLGDFDTLQWLGIEASKAMNLTKRCLTLHTHYTYTLQDEALLSPIGFILLCFFIDNDTAHVCSGQFEALIDLSRCHSHSHNEVEVGDSDTEDLRTQVENAANVLFCSPSVSSKLTVCPCVPPKLSYNDHVQFCTQDRLTPI